MTPALDIVLAAHVVGVPQTLKSIYRLDED
jgi:hypothetical protein